MIIELFGKIAYYVFVFTVYGIGVGAGVFFKELDLLKNLQTRDKMTVYDKNYISPKDKLLLGLIDVLHHWWTGLLLASTVALFQPLPSQILNDALVVFGFGLATPDFVRGIKRFYNNFRKTVDFTKMPVIPDWLKELLESLLPKVTEKAVEEVTEKLNIDDKALTENIQETVSKAIDKILSNLLGEDEKGGKEGEG